MLNPILIGSGSAAEAGAAKSSAPVTARQAIAPLNLPILPSWPGVTWPSAAHPQDPRVKTAGDGVSSWFDRLRHVIAAAPSPVLASESASWRRAAADRAWPSPPAPRPR